MKTAIVPSQEVCYQVLDLRFLHNRVNFKVESNLFSACIGTLHRLIGGGQCAVVQEAIASSRPVDRFSHVGTQEG